MMNRRDLLKTMGAMCAIGTIGVIADRKKTLYWDDLHNGTVSIGRKARLDENGYVEFNHDGTDLTVEFVDNLPHRSMYHESREVVRTVPHPTMPGRIALTFPNRPVIPNYMRKS